MPIRLVYNLMGLYEGMVDFRTKKDSMGNQKVYPIQNGRRAPRGPNRNEIAYLGALAVEGPEGENLKLGAVDFLETSNSLLANLYELEGQMEAEGAGPGEMQQIENAISLLLNAQTQVTSLGTATLEEMEAALTAARDQYSQASAIVQNVTAGLPEGSPEAASISLALEETASAIVDLRNDFDYYREAFIDRYSPFDLSVLMPDPSQAQANENEEWHGEQIQYDQANEPPNEAGPNESWHRDQIAYDESVEGGNMGSAPLSEDVSYSGPQSKAEPEESDKDMKTFRIFPFDMKDRDNEDHEGEGDESL